MEDIEQWKDIPNYEGVYQASTHGRIRSLDRFVPFRNAPRKHDGKILKTFLSWGYPMLVLCKDGVQKKKTVHRLIASTFLGESELYIDHIDRNRLNASLVNLRYCTFRENIVFFSSTRNKTSKHTGVFFNKITEKWRAGIRNIGKYTFLGEFDNEEDAAQIYRNALESISKKEPIIRRPRPSRVGMVYKRKNLDSQPIISYGK